MPLNLTRTADGGIDIITVAGDLDVYTAARLRETILDLRPRWLVLDLGKCEFLDVTGLGVIVGAMHRARLAGGGVAVCGAHERISKIFSLSGLTKLFPMHEDAPAAVRALRGEQEATDA